MAENENDFYVDEYGEIHRKDAPQRLEMMRCGRNIISWNMKFFHIMIKVRKNWHGSKNWKNNWG